MKKPDSMFAAWVGGELVTDIDQFDGPIKVDYAGTGFMMIHRSVFEKMRAFVGGVAGTFVMDFGARRFGSIGINDALGGLLGRWVLGFRSGRFVIDGKSELRTPETNHEAKVGMVFHYIAGGGGVALLYPAFFLISDLPPPGNHIIGGAVFGLLSVLLTWLVQYPCFGFSLFGRNAPEGSTTTWPPAILHTAYGTTMGIVLHIVDV